MNRTDRMTGILLALRGGQRTAAELAARFEVSRRTILRDLDALGQLGVPVVATPGNGGGFALPEGYFLPPLRLSAAEATTVLLGLAALGPPDDSPFGDSRRTAEEKLRAIIDTDTLRASEIALGQVRFERIADQPAAGHLATIQRAIADGRWLRVGYRSSRRTADHTLLPLRLVVADGRWYVHAVSHEAREQRRYRLDRLDELRPVAPPPDADAVIAAAHAGGRDYHHPDNPEVVLRLTGPGVTRAPDVLGVRLAPETEMDGWSVVRFRCPRSELPFYARCVLVLGDDAVAVGPPELVAMIRDVATRTLGRHPEFPIPGAGSRSTDGSLSMS
ncbi:MAG TPA: WYL domain-containing protein [Thermomicrobiales bacterium]|jgi:predicted DNA-binding transcriptional regulator YafY|nr:WYL domain-containing protein [Thermomicrobiales bacterium]